MKPRTSPRAAPTVNAFSASSKLGEKNRRIADLEAEVARLTALLNTPEMVDFGAAVVREAAHQRERWGAAHDATKKPQDWFWLLGFLAGKALHAATAGDLDKAAHHTISSAAALANWHAAITGASNDMRPGIMTPAGETA